MLVPGRTNDCTLLGVPKVEQSGSVGDARNVKKTDDLGSNYSVDESTNTWTGTICYHDKNISVSGAKLNVGQIQGGVKCVRCNTRCKFN